ncbi:MAG: FHA domain-containing protein [Eubacteriales bacterium]
MVRRLAKIGIHVCLFLMLGMTAFASENNRVEQLNGEMPNIEVYFYSEESPQEATLELNKEIITATSITSVEESTNHHFFLVDCSGSISYTQMEAIKTAISTFIIDKNAQDTVTLISFGTTVDVLIDAQTDVTMINETVASLEANQNDTLFFDSLAKAATLSEELPEMDRCLLYVFSDSVDYNLGGYTEDEVENLLNNAGLPLYGFGFESGTKESLDNFGALARATGGEIAIINEDNLITTFEETVEEIHSAYIAKFVASTNILPTRGEAATLTIDNNVAYEMNTNITEYISDELAPEIISATQLENGTVEVVFSENVSGANIADNFIVKDSGGTVIPVSASVYEEEKQMATLTFVAMPETGTIQIATNHINDISQDENLIANTMDLEYTNTAAEKESIKNESTVEVVVQESMTGAYIGMLILVMILAVIIIIIVTQKRKKIQDDIEACDDQRRNTDLQQRQLAGETGKAHFQMEEGKQKLVVLEVSNISGASNRVELAIAQTMFIGRSDICDVVFDDIKMSRQHFVIEDTENGFTITNLSQGGTLLNGIQINNTRPLRYGDVIEAGNQRIVFKI